MSNFCSNCGRYTRTAKSAYWRNRYQEKPEWPYLTLALFAALVALIAYLLLR